MSQTNRTRIYRTLTTRTTRIFADLMIAKTFIIRVNHRLWSVICRFILLTNYTQKHFSRALSSAN